MMHFKLLITTYFIFVGLVQISGQDTQHVLYGEHTVKSKANSNTHRIFYDRNGDLYPDYFIEDKEMVKADNNLADFCKTNPRNFQELASQYRLKDTEYSSKNYVVLQDSILAQSIRIINRKSAAYNTVHFLIHGFRKPFEPKNGSSSSMQFFSRLRSVISQGLKKEEDSFFVEVYWDGTYDCCFSKNIFRNRRLFKLFKKKARQHAVTTGYHLRRVVKEMEKEHLSVISHSLGARVLTACLFNAYTKKRPAEWITYETPSQKRIDVCMVAPAISKKPFDHYYNRTTKLDFKQSDNYQVNIIYNETDFVLKKKWKGLGPGPKRHGRTTLGCNHKNEVVKLQSLFESAYKSSKLKLFHAADVGKCHLMRCYTSTSYFTAFLSGLNQD